LSSDNTKNVETKNLQKSEINKRKSFFPLFFLFFVILLFLSVERIIIGVTPPPNKWNNVLLVLREKEETNSMPIVQNSVFREMEVPPK
jgi:hypothetical protein